MRYTKSVLGVLNKQYRSVLRKCLMINLGIFACMGTAHATYNLNDAVADTETTRNYVLSANENIDTTLGTMGGTNATLTIDGTSKNTELTVQVHQRLQSEA